MNKTLEGFLPFEEYVELAGNTGFFKQDEIDILREVVLDYQKSPNEDYYLLEEWEGAILAGFIIFGRVSMTDCSWDIYWIAVKKELQGKGIGRNLINRMERFILGVQEKAVLRLETSGKAQYENTRNFYKSTGFQDAGFIPDFYTDGDGLQTYYKAIYRK